MIMVQSCSEVPKFTVMTNGSFGAGNYGMCGRAFDRSMLDLPLTEQEEASLNQLTNLASKSLSAVCDRLIAQGLKRNKRTKPKRSYEGENQ